MKIYITGSYGFVGNQLMKQLLSSNLEDEICTCSCDIRDLNSLIRQTKDSDIIIHLAALSRIDNEGSSRIKEYFDINVIGTYNVMESMRLNHIPRLIFSSSTFIPHIEIRENIKPYIWSKYLSEGIITMYSINYGIKTIILRLSEIYGPATKQGIIHQFLQSAKKREPLEIYGNGLQTHDFIHVYDVADAIVKSINLDQKQMMIRVDIGSGVETSIKDLADKISPNQKFLPNKNIGLKGIIVDTTGALKYLGFKPKISLDDGLKELSRNI